MVQRPQFGVTEATRAAVCVTAANRRASRPIPKDRWPAEYRSGCRRSSGEPGPPKCNTPLLPVGAFVGLNGITTQFETTEATRATTRVTAANRRAGYPAPRPLARRVPLGSGEPSPRCYPRGALRGLGGTATPDGGHGGNTRRRGPHSSQSSRRVPTPKTVGRLGNCAHCDDFVRDRRWSEYCGPQCAAKKRQQRFLQKNPEPTSGGPARVESKKEKSNQGRKAAPSSMWKPVGSNSSST
jgi:hypothetical protein